MSGRNDPKFQQYFDSAGYNRPTRHMDEDDALEQAEAEIRRLKSAVKALSSLVEAAKKTMVQHDPNCLVWMKTYDLIREGKL